MIPLIAGISLDSRPRDNPQPRSNLIVLIKSCYDERRKEIGDLFSVSSEVVRRIRPNERWKHI